MSKNASFLPEPVQLLVSGGFAGACSVFGISNYSNIANTPVDVVKTQMQGLKAEQYKGTLDCMGQIWQKEGIRGFYKGNVLYMILGTVPRLGRVVMDVAITMTLYDYISRAMNVVWPPKH